MAIWCMSHPWMTFFIAMMALIVIDNVVNNVIRVVAFALGMPSKPPVDSLESTGDAET